MDEQDGLRAMELPVVPMAVEEVMGVELVRQSGVRLFRTQPQELLAFMKAVWEKNAPELLHGCVATCVGGDFRSGAINSVLVAMGVDVPIAGLTDMEQKGLSMGELLKRITQGEIGDGGSLLPQGFTAPLETLLMGVNLESSERDNLNLFLLGLARKCKKVGRGVNLDVVIVDTRSENDVTGPARELRHWIEDRRGREG